jgi:hypothetical protein
MGIRFTCPNGHKLHVKAFLAGKRGVCPQCGAKILIPTEVQAEQRTPVATPPLERGGPIGSTVAIAGAVTAVDSPSIVVSISDSSVTAPVVDAPGAMSPSMASKPEAATETAKTGTDIQAESAAPPIVVRDVIEPVSPAGQYVAYRQRKRRNQLVFAAMLLVAVIVLAGVLIFVLQRGAESAPLGQVQAANCNLRRTMREIVTSNDYYSNAHQTTVANS